MTRGCKDQLESIHRPAIQSSSCPRPATFESKALLREKSVSGSRKNQDDTHHQCRHSIDEPVPKPPRTTLRKAWFESRRRKSTSGSTKTTPANPYRLYTAYWRPNALMRNFVETTLSHDEGRACQDRRRAHPPTHPHRPAFEQSTSKSFSPPTSIRND